MASLSTSDLTEAPRRVTWDAGEPAGRSRAAGAKRHFACKGSSTEREDESSGGTPWFGRRGLNSDRWRFSLRSLHRSYRRSVVGLLLGLNIRDDFADLVRAELVDKGGHHVPAELRFYAHVLDTGFAARKGKLLVLKEAE